MILDNSVKPYLRGEKFDNGLLVKTADKQKFISRLDYLTNYATNKKIVHVGCTDHIPIIKDKIENGTWLHKKLDAVAKKQIGIDIDEKAVDYVKSNFAINNIICMNIIEDDVPVEILNDNWDGLILGELLEHIDNPVAFLSTIHVKYRTQVKDLVITVPNALSLSNFYHAFFRNSERINTDHRYWFTPYTLQKILIRAGFTPLYHEFASYYSLNPNKPVRNFFLRKLLEKRPILRSNLIMVSKF